MGELKLEEQGQIDKPLRDLIEIIHFTENVSTNIHGLLDEAEIYRTVREEFAKSKRYDAGIFLLTDDASKLRVSETSESRRKFSVAERATGILVKEFEIDLNKSSIYSQVVRDGKTIQVKVTDILEELLQRPIAYLVSKIMGYEKKNIILTPLYKYGKIIGAIAVSSPELAEYFIPSVRNLAQHISTALELADQLAKRKQMEEELRESEERWRSLVELAPDSIVTVNMHGLITSVNPATLRLTGYSEDEIVGKYFSKTPFLQGRDIPKYLKLFTSLLRGKIPKPFEVTYHRKDGTTGWVEAHVGFLEVGGRRIGIQVIMRDITEHKRYEEQLEALHRHAAELTSAETVEEVAERTFNAIERVLGFSYGGFGVVEGDAHHVIYMRGVEMPFPSRLPLNGKGITVRTINTGETQLIPDTRLDEDYVGFQNGNEFLSELAVPVKIQDEVVGVINVESTMLYAFTGEDRRLLEIFSEHVASAVQRLGEQAEQRRYEERLEALHRHATELGRAETVEDIAESTFNAIEGVLGFNQGGFGVVEGSLLSFIHIRGVETEEAFELPFDGPGVTVRAFRTGETQLVPDIRQDEDFVPGLVEGGYETLSELAVPVKVDGEVVSVINIESEKLNVFTDEDKRLMEIFACHTGQGLSRIKQTEWLRASEERYRELFGAVTDGLFQTDLEGNYIMVNSAYAAIFGYKPEDMLDGRVKTWDNYTSLEEREAHLEELRKKGELRNKVMRFKRRDGSTGWIEVSLSIRRGEGGEIIGYEGIARDITERKRMEEELRHYSEQLKELVEERTIELKETQDRLLEAERMAAIGETAAMVGHDLRNPLQAIMNTIYLERKMMKSPPLLGMEVEERQGVEKLLTTLENQVSYMEKIVYDLQDYARPLEPELVETSLHQLINDTLSTITIPETVKVYISIEGDFPRFMVDPILMKRVFTNLITNAVQAMSDGGLLTIRTSKSEETLSISIQDTGEGISKENFPKLFQPLFTTKAKGQGFGLPVCKRIVEAHDGTITVESEVNKGSIFTVQIPLRLR